MYVYVYVYVYVMCTLSFLRLCVMCVFVMYQDTYSDIQDGHLTNTTTNHQDSSVRNFVDVSSDKDHLFPDEETLLTEEELAQNLYEKFLVDTPRQCYSSNDCGRLMCTIMRLIVEDIDPDTPLFTVHDMPMARYRLILELMSQKVLCTNGHDV